MSTALILIDIQNDYFPGGKCELVNIEQAATNSRDLLSYFRENKLPLFHIQHIEEDADAEFFAPNSKGAEIHESVKPLDTEKTIVKRAPNSFLNTSLKNELDAAGIKHLVLTGNMSHMCVDATARAALDYGYECTVVEDSCTTYDAEFKGSEIPAAQVHGAFMNALEEAGCTVCDLKTFLSNQ